MFGGTGAKSLQQKERMLRKGGVILRLMLESNSYIYIYMYANRQESLDRDTGLVVTLYFVPT